MTSRTRRARLFASPGPLNAAEESATRSTCGATATGNRRTDSGRPPSTASRRSPRNGGPSAAAEPSLTSGSEAQAPIWQPSPTQPFQGPTDSAPATRVALHARLWRSVDARRSPHLTPPPPPPRRPSPGRTHACARLMRAVCALCVAEGRLTHAQRNASRQMSARCRAH